MIVTFEVYRHTSPSGKSYVGWTSYGWRFRWNAHVNDARHGGDTAFHRAIRKYGPESFTHEVLERMTTEAGAKRAEQLWIRELGARANGYNETDGGDGTMGYRHTAHARKRMSEAHAGANTPEARARQSRSLTGYRHSADAKAKMSASRTGVKRSDETRAKLRAAALGRKHSPQTKAKLSAAARLRPPRSPEFMARMRAAKGNGR